MNELTTMPLRRLLRLHAGIMDELRCRGVVRKENSPTGNGAEQLGRDGDLALALGAALQGPDSVGVQLRAGRRGGIDAGYRGESQ